jgi:UPF0176 protein
MALLHNRVSHKELKQKLFEENFKRTTISFYHYFSITEPTTFRDEMFRQLRQLQVFGRIYLATEGINAQISVPEHNYEAFKNYLYSIPELNNIRLNIAVDDDGKSFFVLAIKVRNKIVADGITDASFSMEQKGKYVNAQTFNKLAADKDTIIIDMRNHYEYEVGHFEQAIEIPSATFREQLPMAVDMMQDNKDKNIIMYCTGGIRCEKASAYMLHHGFTNVYHLEGGIINYSQQAKQEELPNLFKGKNFVFDQRLGERISDDIIAKCHQCGQPADTHTNCANEGCHLLFIQCPACAAEMNGCCTIACKEIVALPLEEQKALRANKENDAKIFNKRKENLRLGK